MELAADQLTKLREWAAAGETLSGIQKHLEEEFNLRMTYMQLRFLMDDYSVEIASPKPAPAKEEVKPAAAPDAQAVDSTAGVQDAEEMELAGGVTVEADRINRPGSVLSGSVTFSDGVKAKWYLDQMGRLGLDGVDKTYRPSPEDVQDFQMELQKIAHQKGF